MIYSRSNNILEIFLKNKGNLHNIEDYLREKLFYKNEYLSHIETIFLARILYGRIINSNEVDQKLDARHSKAQIITVTCLAFYLYKNKNILNKIIETELYNLLYYHVILIEQYLTTYLVNSTDPWKTCIKSESTRVLLRTPVDSEIKFQNDNSLDSRSITKNILSSFRNDDNYYNYCKDLNFICKIIILHNKLNLNNNNEITKNVDKIIVYINPSVIDYIKVKNSNLKKYISNLNISDFYDKTWKGFLVNESFEINSHKESFNSVKYQDYFNFNKNFDYDIYNYLQSYSHFLIQPNLYKHIILENLFNNY